MAINIFNEFINPSVYIEYVSDTYAELVTNQLSYLDKIVFCTDTNYAYLVTIGNIVPVYNISQGSRYIKISKTYLDFQNPSTTKSVEIYSLLAKEVVKNVVMKHEAQFAGTGLVSFNISVGIVGTQTKYTATKTMTGVPSSTNFLTMVSATTNQAPLDFVSAVPIIAFATSTGANLSVLTSGTVDFYLEIGKLP